MFLLLSILIFQVKWNFCIFSGLIGSVQIDSIIPFILRAELTDLKSHLSGNLTSAAADVTFSPSHDEDVFAEGSSIEDSVLANELDDNQTVLTNDAPLNGRLVQSDDESRGGHVRNVILVESVPSLTFDEPAVETSS